MVTMSALEGVRGRYRLRVRYRLTVLAYAMAEGVKSEPCWITGWGRTRRRPDRRRWAGEP